MASASATGVSESSAMQRLPGVDVLRGIAALLVVLHHIHLRFQIKGYEVRDLLPEFLGQFLFWSGYYAVIAFFVISGFLITRLSLRRWGSLQHVRFAQFYQLRAARILPCLLLLLVVLSTLHLLGVTEFVIKPERASLPRALVAALTFHVNWLEGHRGYLPGNWDVLWSLSVEEAFYLVFPIACLAVKREKLLLVCLLALIVVGPLNRMALSGSAPWDEYAYLSCMDGIAFGCIAGWLSTRIRLSELAGRAAMIVGIVAVVLVVVLRKLTLDLGLTKLGLNVTLLELGMALILLALANGVGALAHRGTAPLRFVGRCSYEIYLTHMFVVFGLMRVFTRVFEEAPPSHAAFFAAYLAMLLMSIGLGYLVERRVSEPMNNWLRRKWLRDEGRTSPVVHPSPTAAS